MKEQINRVGRRLSRFKIFLASPGDLEKEREYVRSIINQFNGERAFRENIKLEPIAWDQPGVEVPMEAVLTPQESERLFKILKKMSMEGLSIIFITHKLNEVVQVSDRVTVLRRVKKIDTVNSWEITKAELDRRIEGFVERQLAQMAGGMPPEQLNKQKEALIARLGNASERQRFLQQFLSEQILYLKAREDKLPENPEVRAQLLDAERSILANETMRRALTERIQITPSDVHTFYDASKAQFMTPAQAKIRHILLPDEEQAKAALNSLTAGKDFAELAKTASKDKGTADQGGELPGLQAGTPTVPGIGQAPELAKAVFAGEVGKVLPIPYKTAQGWHVVKIDERQPEKQRTFEEAREEAYSRLLSRKQQEVQKTLFEELRTRYDVVVHRDQLAPAKPEAGPGK